MPRGLLSRLGDTAPGSPGWARGDVGQAIAEHLRFLLNTRQGSSEAAPGYGLVDFADLVHAFPAAIQRLQAAIRATVLEYEPRLSNVSVRHLEADDPLLLKFEISGQLHEDAGRALLRFRTQVAPGGRVDVL